jgi:hypothetical protein
MTALKLPRQQQDADREHAASGWTETGLVFTTRFGTPIEPRNFTRSFDRRIGKAQVRRITVHGTRKSCGSLLAASTSTRAWPCRFCGIARSPSRWRSTPKSCPRRHVKRSASSVTSSAPEATAALCSCTSMQNGRFLDRNRPLTWEPRYGIEP